MSVPVLRPAIASVSELIELVLAAQLGPDPADQRISVSFLTRQSALHSGRGRGYRNEVISLRLGAAVGSCAVEPDEVQPSLVDDCVGATIAELLNHSVRAVRIAALDAYLMRLHPHDHAPNAEPVTIAGGSSLEKSMARAAAVVDLVPARPGQIVLVIGTVNSLLAQLRRRGERYLACDLTGGTTEWGETIITEASAVLGEADAILASGMTLGNDTFEPLLRHVRRDGIPLVMFAQTGSAVLPWFLGDGVHAVSAEPYPFFWLDGGHTVVYHYRAEQDGLK
jgi:putative heavy-metal chelation protein